MKRVAAALVAMGLGVVWVGAAKAADPEVAGLQVALRAHGLYQGAIDGIAGPQTRRAVLVFQRRKGLAVDGRAGPRTRAALGPLGRPLLGRRLIARGALGLDVASLQFLLSRRGLYDGPLDGSLGPRTEGALRAFQRRAGLFADGVVGPVTLAALRGSAPAAAVRRAAPRRPTIVVRNGDTLTGIAARHGTTVGALARENRLNPAGTLFAGAVLRVPAAAAAAPSSVRALVDGTARRYGVDPDLARALAWMESGYQTNLTSPVGAWGVMQIIPATWDFVETVLLGRDVPRTAAGNVEAGVVLLRHLLRRFAGNERLALAAWYQGERAVREHGVYRESKWFASSVLALRRRGV
jgi:peptidoglycan hydrolase-like protein with peptidoglycan-binding domain